MRSPLSALPRRQRSVSATGNGAQRRPTLRHVSGLATAAMLLTGFVIPVNFVTEEPGPTFNTIGDYEGKQLIDIEGTKTYGVSGNLDMTTVSVAGGPNTHLGALQALGTWLQPNTTVLPSDLLYSHTVTSQEVREQNTADMSDSQEIAQAAALNYLKKPVTEKLTVTGVVKDGASVGKLQEGDVLQKIDSTSITAFGQISDVLGKTKDQPVTVTVLRDGKTVTEKITPKLNTSNNQYLLGVSIKRHYNFPFTVKYGLEEVGGPSAGMMFSLGIIDELTPGDMTGGKHFAGTGTIESDGTVGPIGGIAQKMVGARQSGATIFLAPSDNCDEVVDHVPDGMSVIKVSKLSDAVDAVTEVGKGKDPASLPTCTAE